MNWTLEKEKKSQRKSNKLFRKKKYSKKWKMERLLNLDKVFKGSKVRLSI